MLREIAFISPSKHENNTNTIYNIYTDFYTPLRGFSGATKGNFSHCNVKISYSTVHPLIEYKQFIISQFTDKSFNINLCKKVVKVRLTFYRSFSACLNKGEHFVSPKWVMLYSF
jgi:hypothetical protein